MPNPVAQVTATFNPANETRRVTFSSSDFRKLDDGKVSNSIDFKNDAPGTVRFTLDSQQTALKANFPSNPIQWVRRINESLPASLADNEIDTNLTPIDPPPGVTVHRDDDTHTTVTIATSMESRTLRFYVIVQTTDGRFFGTDPTIVTMPPGT